MAVKESERRIRLLVTEIRKLAPAVRDSPERRRRLFLLLGASYGLIRAERLAYSADDGLRFSEPVRSRDEFEDVAQDLIAESSVTLEAVGVGGPDVIRKWMGGFYFGSAAFRLHQYRDSFEEREGRPIESTEAETFRLYVEWFKHGGDRPTLMAGVPEGVVFLRELIAAERTVA